MCGKGALPVEHLAHWAEFWAKKRPRKIILGQNFWANFFHLQRHRGGHPGVPRGSVGCVGVWGSPRVGWAVGARMGWGAVGWVGLIDFLAQNEMEKN